MQNVELEIGAPSISEAIEAGINQTAEKYKVDVIQVKRYSAYRNGNSIAGIPVYRVSLDFISDPALFDDNFAEEGFISDEDW